MVAPPNELPPEKPKSKVDALMECRIDSNNCRGLMDSLFKCMIDETTTSEDTMRLAGRIYSTFYEIVSSTILTKYKRDYTIDLVSQIVYDETEMPIPLRLIFANFKDHEMVFKIATGLREDGVRERMVATTYFQIPKLLLRNALLDRAMEESIIAELNVMFADPLTTYEEKSDIADIMLHTRFRARGMEMLDELRRLDDLRRDNVNPERPREPLRDNVYNDAQNVHNHTINDGSIQACLRLINLVGKRTANLDECQQILLGLFPNQRDGILLALDRIQVDVVMFAGVFSLRMLYNALWVFILDERDDETIASMARRLGEEVLEARNYCSTGYMARMINSIQGFDIPKELTVTISADAQAKAVIQTTLDKALLEAPVDIMDAMIGRGEQQRPFIDFVVNTINQAALHREYGDIIFDVMIETVRKYTYTDADKWKLTDKVLSFLTILTRPDWHYSDSD